MNMRNVLLVVMRQSCHVLFLALILSSCGVDQSKYDNLVKENKELKTKIEQMQKELKAYELSPSILCANITTLFEEDNLDELQKIRETLSKYHPMSMELKQVNEFCEKIKAKRKAAKEAEEKERMKAVNKLKKKYDDVSGTTWYQNPYFTHYTNSNLTSLYIGKDESSVWLRLKMSYYGDSWIFFDSAYLSYDGNTREIIFNEYRDKKTENDTEVWEWIDVSVDSGLLSFLREMVKGKSLKMRLSGKYTKTRNLSSKEIQAMKDILLAYDVLKFGE